MLNLLIHYFSFHLLTEVSKYSIFIYPGLLTVKLIVHLNDLSGIAPDNLFAPHLFISSLHDAVFAPLFFVISD